MGRRFNAYAKYADGVLTIRFFDSPIHVEVKTEEDAIKYLEKFRKTWQQRLNDLDLK